MKNSLRTIFAGAVICVIVGCAALPALPANPFSRTQFRVAQTMYEVHSCTLLDSREFECDVTITNYNNAKAISSGGMKIRDNLGNEYIADNPGYGNRTYAPEERFRHTLRANNVSTQATSVKAITGGLTVRGGPGASFRGEFILSGMNTFVSREDAKNASAPVSAPTKRPVRLSVREADATFEVHGCTLLPSREFECDVSITSFYQSKTVRIGSLVIRDDAGIDYKVQQSPSFRAREYAPDEKFRHTVRVSNISSAAKSVAAVHGGLIVRGPKSYRGEFILYGMETVEGDSATQPASSVTSAARQPAISTNNLECRSQAPNLSAFAGMNNIALTGMASQSSTGHFNWDAAANLANDGNTNGDYYQKSVSHTLQEIGAWWQVDIRGTHPLQKIVIWNRTDHGWGKRLTNFKVIVSDSSGNTVYERGYCGSGTSFSPAMVVDLPPGTQGQFVKIKLNDNNYLQLAEVEVFSSTAQAVTSNEPDSVAAAEPVPVSQPARVANTSTPTEIAVAPLVGCWQWSNGMTIDVDAGGTAKNGFASGSWFENGGSYVIRWPDFTGSVTLSTDGQALDGIDAIGTRSSARRLNGPATSFMGAWQWDNGGVVTVSPDGTMSAGHLAGSWSGTGKNYQTVWPIVDSIAVSSDGTSLTGQNQFGAFNATRQSSCR